MKRLLLLLASVAAHETSAYEIVDARFSESDGRYRYFGEFIVEQPIDAVREFTRHHEHMHLLSDDITASSIVTRDGAGNVTRKMEMRTCVAFFCVRPTMVQRVIEHADGSIETVVLPEQSDFRSGHTTWRFQTDGENRTRITFEGERQPSFATPPLLADGIYRRKARQELEVTASRLESLSGALMADGNLVPNTLGGSVVSNATVDLSLGRSPAVFDPSAL